MFKHQKECYLFLRADWQYYNRKSQKELQEDQYLAEQLTGFLSRFPDLYLKLIA